MVILSGPRQREDRGGGHQARGLRLHREAAGDASASCSWPETPWARSSLRDENRRLKLSFDERYRDGGGEPGPRRRVLDAVRRAAPTNATVLITGESGAGKELVARAIHRNSLRKDEAFVQVNCAAIPEELIESELFGHEKGSFTGATEKQIGKFELAHKGTIFLDEVGDMSLQDPGQGPARAAGGRGRAHRLAEDACRWTCG